MSEQTQNTETAETVINFSEPLNFLGGKVVSSGFVQGLINNYHADKIIVPGTELPVRGSLKLQIPGAIDTNVVILGYSVTPNGTLLNMALQIHQDVFVLLNNIPYSTALLRTETPTEPSEE